MRFYKVDKVERSILQRVLKTAHLVWSYHGWTLPDLLEREEKQLKQQRKNKSWIITVCQVVLHIKTQSKMSEEHLYPQPVVVTPPRCKASL